MNSGRNVLGESSERVWLAIFGVASILVLIAMIRSILATDDVVTAIRLSVVGGLGGVALASGIGSLDGYLYRHRPKVWLRMNLVVYLVAASLFLWLVPARLDGVSHSSFLLGFLARLGLAVYTGERWYSAGWRSLAEPPED